MTMGDIDGNKGNKDNTGKVILNHYTVDIPDDTNNKLGEKPNQYTINNNKIQIADDGDCFYTAVAVWCKIYGITEEHLNSITYNVPFDFSEDHFKKNLKVPESTEQNKIPEPIEFPTNLTFIKTDALIIAQNMKNKITGKDFNPTFEEKTIDENHTEYKEYVQNGITKDNGTHCNKYKGNMKQDETKVEVEGN